MNFIAICLHSLDMRDFHSRLRDTPSLDELRKRTVFIPCSRGQGHNNKDSINSEITGQWTARHSDSQLTREGFQPLNRAWLSKTLMEYLHEDGYDIITCNSGAGLGNASVSIGMADFWLKDEPERMWQFDTHHGATIDELISAMRGSKKFYAHLFLRQTHRPWAQVEGLCALAGQAPARSWPGDAFCARKAALERPSEFAALRRRGLAMADQIIQKIYQATADLQDTCFIVYSNHGEVFDHFRYHLPYKNTNSNMIVGVSHGPYPYEVLYANMQMWLIPGMGARVISGMGRSIDYAPTVLDLAGLDRGPMDGRSMRPAFACKGSLSPAERLAESGTAECGSCLSMVRADGLKLISMTPEPVPGEAPADAQANLHAMSVFDLSSDPQEYVDLIDTPLGADVLDWAVQTHQSLKSRP